MRYLIVLSLASSLLFSCNWTVNDEPGFGSNRPPDEVIGLKPIYAEGDWTQITVLPPQPIDRLGKIYYKDKILFVNELYQGVHVIDNTDPVNPVFLHFFKIPGNKDIAIKGNILYADNVTDLVALDISELADPKVTKRLEDIYDDENFLDYPENYWGYFECPDPEKGVVVAWEETTLEYPECWR